MLRTPRKHWGKGRGDRTPTYPRITPIYLGIPLCYSLRLLLIASFLLVGTATLFLSACTKNSEDDILGHAAQRLVELGHLELAEQVLQIALDKYGGDPRILSAAYRRLGHEYSFRCLADKAEQSYQTAARISEAVQSKNKGRHRPDSVYHDIALIYLDRGKFAEAEDYFRRAYQDIESTDYAGLLAKAYKGQGKYAEAQRLYEKAIRYHEKKNSHLPVWAAYEKADLAHVLLLQGKHDDAEKLFKESIKVMEKTGDAAESALIPALRNYAQLLRSQGHGEAAEQAQKRAGDLRAKRLDKARQLLVAAKTASSFAEIEMSSYCDEIDELRQHDITSNKQGRQRPG